MTRCQETYVSIALGQAACDCGKQLRLWTAAGLVNLGHINGALGPQAYAEMEK